MVFRLTDKLTDFLFLFKFIRKLLPEENERPASNSSLLSPRNDIREYPITFNGTRIVLADTPATNISDDILQDVQDWMGSRAIR